jgi:hypothetical protein
MRRVQLPDDRTLVIRPTEADDVDGLVKLYEGLDEDDRYRRFFSMYWPRPHFFERLVVAAERGGACLAAEVVDAVERVAEAHSRRFVGVGSREDRQPSLPEGPP